MTGDSVSIETQIVSAIQQAITEGRTPGGVCLVGRGEQTICHTALGDRMLHPRRLPMKPDTIFDLASVTKCVATATVIFQQIEQGLLSLDDPVRRWLPEFSGEGRDAVAIRHLLTHSSGLPAHRNYMRLWDDEVPPGERRECVVRDICRLPLQHAPGERTIYSCLGFIVLARIAEIAAGRSLPDLAREGIFEPLEMGETCFCPPEETRARCAATEQLPEGTLQGVVHDENSRYLGGVAGNAGLFSTAADLARFARAIIDDGGGVLRPESVDAVLTGQVWHEGVGRTLGWRLPPESDTHLNGAPTAESVGHTGYTGTCLWIDRARGVFVVLLTNRVHLGREVEIDPLRKRVGEIVGRFIGG